MSAREHGIIFSGWSVVAIGKELKTQTRRLDRGQKPYQTGDRLWVRESWRAFERESDAVDGILFAADGAFQRIENTFAAADLWVVAHDNGRFGDEWRPAMYMPRWVSRYTLEVTAVRHQRVQDISEADALAEGVSSGVIPATGDHPRLIGFVYGRDDGACVLHPFARDAYALAWDALNARRRRREYLQIGDPDYRGRPWRTVIDETACWAANPMVYAYTFKVVPR